MEWRSRQPTRWHRQCTTVLRQILPKLELRAGSITTEKEETFMEPILEHYWVSVSSMLLLLNCPSPKTPFLGILSSGDPRGVVTRINIVLPIYMWKPFLFRHGRLGYWLPVPNYKQSLRGSRNQTTEFGDATKELKPRRLGLPDKMKEHITSQANLL